MVDKPDVDKISSRRKTLQFSLQISNSSEHSATALPQISKKVSSSHQRAAFAPQPQPDTCHLHQLELKPSPNPPALPGSRQPNLDSVRARCRSISVLLLTGICSLVPTLERNSTCQHVMGLLQGLSATATTLGGDTRDLNEWRTGEPPWQSLLPCLHEAPAR